MCDKKRFPVRALAIQRITEINTRGELRDKMPVRAYYCRECGGWHLTSIDMPKAWHKYYNENRFSSERIEWIAERWIKKNKWTR